MKIGVQLSILLSYSTLKKIISKTNHVQTHLHIPLSSHHKKTKSAILIEFHYKNKKIVTISDTHGHHRELIIPNTDFLIHCGDACTDGNVEQLKDFFQWFSAQRARYKIFVAGNHDLPFDLDLEGAINLITNNVVYLENRYAVMDGISFYSAPA